MTLHPIDVPSHGSKPLSTGAFAAIVVIVVLLVVAGSVLIGLLAWKRKKAKRQAADMET